MPLDDLAAALRERDATAAAQAETQTTYLVTAFRVLQPADQRVLLSVLSTGGMILGSTPHRGRRLHGQMAVRWPAAVRAVRAEDPASAVLQMLSEQLVMSAAARHRVRKPHRAMGDPVT